MPPKHKAGENSPVRASKRQNKGVGKPTVGLVTSPTTRSTSKPKKAKKSHKRKSSDHAGEHPGKVAKLGQAQGSARAKIPARTLKTSNFKVMTAAQRKAQQQEARLEWQARKKTCSPRTQKQGPSTPLVLDDMVPAAQQTDEVRRAWDLISETAKNREEPNVDEEVVPQVGAQEEVHTDDTPPQDHIATPPPEETTDQVELVIDEGAIDDLDADLNNTNQTVAPKLSTQTVAEQTARLDKVAVRPVISPIRSPDAGQDQQESTEGAAEEQLPNIYPPPPALSRAPPPAAIRPRALSITVDNRSTTTTNTADRPVISAFRRLGPAPKVRDNTTKSADVQRLEAELEVLESQIARQRELLASVQTGPGETRGVATRGTQRPNTDKNAKFRYADSEWLGDQETQAAPPQEKKKSLGPIFTDSSLGESSSSSDESDSQSSSYFSSSSTQEKRLQK